MTSLVLLPPSPAAHAGLSPAATLLRIPSAPAPAIKHAPALAPTPAPAPPAAPAHPRPDERPLFELQVAGHGNIARAASGMLLKPSSAKERAFYDLLATNPDSFTWLREFIPRYFGILHTTTPTTSSSPSIKTGPVTEFLQLQDLTDRLARPCVLDIKLGARGWDDDATPAKIRKLRARAAATTSGACGLRLAGLRRESAAGAVQTAGRGVATALTAADLPAALRWFLSSSCRTCGVRVAAARRFLGRVRALQDAMMRNADFFFYGASLLVTFDGAASAASDAGLEVSLIDFAHTVRADGARDENALHGLRNLVSLLEAVVADPLGAAYLPAPKQG